MLLRELANSGVIKAVETHSKQGLYTPVAVATEKTATAPVEQKDAGKGKGAPKKAAEKKDK